MIRNLSHFHNKYEHAIINIFIIAVGFLKIPSFYILSDSTFSSTHTIFKIIIIWIFCIEILVAKSRKYLQNSLVFLFLLLVFLSQSVSIITAVDIQSFLKQYQNLILDMILFILAFIFIQTIYLRKKIIQYIYIIAAIVIVLELFLLFIPDLFFTFFTSIIPIQKEFMDLYIYNYYSLSRFNLFLHSELFFPFFLHGLFRNFYSNNSRKKSLALFLGVITLFVISVASKFRTRFIQSIFALLAYFISIRRFFYKFILVAIFFFMISTSFILFTEINNHTVFDRILAPDEREDIDTVNFRRKQLNESIDHIRAYPLFGVGLGNYKSYLNHSNGMNIVDPYAKIHFESTTDAPHSIFIQLLSETGIIGMLSFGLFLAYSLNHDLQVYRNKKETDEVLIFIIASWTIFLYGIMNPFNTVFLNSWFWFLRGIIHGLTYHLKIFKKLEISDT